MDKKIIKKLDKIFNRVSLRDSLYNCSYDCANTPELIQYGKGVLVGIVSVISTINDTEINFYRTIEYLKSIISEKKNWIYGNHEINPDCIPDAWKEDFSRVSKF